MSNSLSSTRTFRSSQSSSAEKPEPQKPYKQRTPINKKRLFYITAIVLLMIAVVVLFTQYRHSQQKLKKTSPEYFSAQQERLAKLILLPANETPTIATVKDTTKLQNESFYQEAVNGDLLFVYNDSHKAILYRPSKNIIVNVAPVSVNTNGTSSN